MGVQLSGAGSGAAYVPAADAGTLAAGTAPDSGCMWIGVRANGLLPLLISNSTASQPFTSSVQVWVKQPSVLQDVGCGVSGQNGINELYLCAVVRKGCASGVRARGDGAAGPSRRPNLLGPTEWKGLIDREGGACPTGVPAAPLLCAGNGCRDPDPGLSRGCHGDPAARGLLLRSVTLRALMSSYDEPAPSVHHASASNLESCY